MQKIQACCFLLTYTLALAEFSKMDLVTSWINFKVQYGKTYSDVEEEIQRYRIYQENKKNVEKHNKLFEKGVVSYKQSVNRFSDMTVSELAAMRGLRVSERRQGLVFTGSAAQTPDSIDWRTKGVITSVKDQGKCGSCWAFSSTGSVEGAYALQTGQLVSLSEQELVDCSGPYGNAGCGGGFMDHAFQFIKENGLVPEGSYPYNGTDDICTAGKLTPITKLSGYMDIEAGDESALKEAVAKQPVSVGIFAATDSFLHYSSGIYDEPFCSSTIMDHGVLAVGYGTENGKDYWIVKNSWGAGWGENGYIKMSRNKDNQCGISSMASFPVI